MDLEVVKSGGELLGRYVRRVLLEVISDDCRAIYNGQPLCSEVVATMASLGFEQLTPMPCRPSSYRGKANSKCELEMVFRHHTVSPVMTPSQLPQGMREEDARIANDVYMRHHQGYFNWCSGFYPIAAKSPVPNQPGGRGKEALPPADYPPGIWRRPPAGAILAGAYFHQGFAFYSSEWRGPRNHSNGQPYMCPISCKPCVGSRGECAVQGNATHLLGIPWGQIMRYHLSCPFW